MRLRRSGSAGGSSVGRRRAIYRWTAWLPAIRGRAGSKTLANSGGRATGLDTLMFAMPVVRDTADNSPDGTVITAHAPAGTIAPEVLEPSRTRVNSPSRRS